MKSGIVLSIISAPLLSIVIQFVFIFNGYDNGGLAMVPFVYVPIMIIIIVLMLIVNAVYSYKKSVK